MGERERAREREGESERVGESSVALNIDKRMRVCAMCFACVFVYEA